MTDKFIAGISSTGSMQGSRWDRIPEFVDRFGPYISNPNTGIDTGVPQGDDERPGWVLEIIQAIWQRTPGIVQRGDNAFQTYDRIPDIEFVGGDAMPLRIPQDVFGLRHEISAAAGVLNKRHKAATYWPAKLKVGVPMPTIDLAQFTFPAHKEWPNQPKWAEIHKEAFARLVLEEIFFLQTRLTNQHMVLWLESPASLLAMHLARNNNQDMDTVAAGLAKEFAAFARQLPPGLEVFIHLCRGDNNHRSWFGSIDGLEPMVVLINAIKQHWPDSHVKLAGVHAPTTVPEEKPSVNPEFFAPLGRIRREVPIILGNIHPLADTDLSDKGAVRHNLRSFEVAAHMSSAPIIAGSLSCGGGRMSRAEYERSLDVKSGMIAQAGVHGRVKRR